jgi:hypothetical protein
VGVLETRPIGTFNGCRKSNVSPERGKRGVNLPFFFEFGQIDSVRNLSEIIVYRFL